MARKATRDNSDLAGAKTISFGGDGVLEDDEGDGEKQTSVRMERDMGGGIEVLLRWVQ